MSGRDWTLPGHATSVRLGGSHDGDSIMHESVNRLMLELLAWVASQPRTHAEALAAWRSGCPRHPVWDDALNAGLIRVERDDPMNQPRAVLTQKGRSMLDGNA